MPVILKTFKISLFLYQLILEPSFSMPYIVQSHRYGDLKAGPCSNCEILPILNGQESNLGNVLNS